MKITLSQMTGRGKLAAACLVLTVGTGLAAVLPAGAASASGVNIDRWNSAWCEARAIACFFYSPGGSGAHILFDSNSIANLSGYTFYGGGAGNGRPVRNDAASMSNGYAHCSLWTYVSPSFQGNYNYVTGGYGGNLTDTGQVILRNNEASFMQHC